MRKRDSKRRWKARYLIGRWVPLQALLVHELEAWAERYGPAWWDPIRQCVRAPATVRWGQREQGLRKL